MTDSKKTFSIIGLALIIANLLIMVLSRFVFGPLLVKADIAKLAETIGPSMLLLLTYVPNMFVLGIFWLFVRKIPKSEWQGETMSFKSLFQIFVMTYAVAIVFHLIGTAISKAAPAGGSEQLEMISEVVSTGLLIGILLPVILAPILEELIFRKLMLDRIRNYGERTAIIFSALCFGLYHGNLTQFLYAFIVGLFLGYVYCKTGKIRYTIALHTLLNLLSTSVMLIAPRMENGKGTLLTLAVLALLIVTVFIMGVVQLICHLKKKDLRLDNSMLTAIPSGEVVKTVYLNPCVMLFLLYFIAVIVMNLMKISL